MVGEEEEEENRVDREWRELLENSKLLSASKSGLDVTYITGLVRTYVGHVTYRCSTYITGVVRT